MQAVCNLTTLARALLALAAEPLVPGLGHGATVRPPQRDAVDCWRECTSTRSRAFAVKVSAAQPVLPTSHANVASRLRGRVQLTTDGRKPYLTAVVDAFGADIDDAMLQKIGGAERQRRHHSAAQCPAVKVER